MSDIEADLEQARMGIQLLHVRARHIAFAAPGDAAELDEAGAGPAPRMQLNVRNRSTQLAEHTYEVVLELTVSCVRGSTTVYQAEVHQAGLFELPDGVADVRSALETSCPRALFPVARRMAEELVRAGGFPLFQLPPVDFDAIYASHAPAQPRLAPRPAPQPGATQPPAPATPLVQLEHFWSVVTSLQHAMQAATPATDHRAIHAQAWKAAQLSRDVLPAADEVLAQAPDRRDVLESLGAVYTMNNAHRRAAEVYRHAIAARPDDARACYNLAVSSMAIGDTPAAERAIADCIARQPDVWDAYSVRSQLRRQSASNNHVDALRALLKQHAGEPRAREHLAMALGREYEDLGDFAQAFRCFTTGNAVGKARRRYDSRQDAALFDELTAHGAAVDPAAPGCETDEPIFVFGMPRSGTTLLERILASHPQVTAGGELKQFGMLLKCMSDSPTAAILDVDTLQRSRELDWQALGERYLASTRPLSGRTRHFIDKLPQHFLYAGHIIRALPHAKIICVRRNPMDTCLGSFRQLYSDSSPFHGYASDILDIGRYYVRFDRLMQHWQQLYPGRIMELSYEELVANQEAGTRAMLAFCGLPWDDACMHFEANRAPVSTASASRVRAPIYHNAVDRWRHYAGELQPLRELLGNAGVAGIA